MDEIVDFEESKLELIVKESGLEKTKADVILARFQNYFELAADWERKARTIVVTDDTQTDEMKMARTGRLLLRDKRLAIENSRKELKEQALREGKAIDGIANVLKALIVPIEEYLERQEKFTENRIAAEIRQKQLDIERKAAEDEQKRIAEEAADRERMRIENDRLRRENAKIEQDRQKEREESQRIQREKDALEYAKRKAIQYKADVERREADRKHIAELKAAQDKADAERNAARLKAEQERKEKERLEAILKNTVKCPHCKKEFQLNQESEDF